MKCICLKPVTKECVKCKFQECVRCCYVVMDTDECRQCSLCDCDTPTVTKCNNCTRPFCMKCNEHPRLCLECRCYQCDKVSEWKCTCDRNWCYVCHIPEKCQECLFNSKTVNICRKCTSKCHSCGINRSVSHYYSVDEDIVHDDCYCDKCLNSCVLCEKVVGEEDSVTTCRGTCGRRLCEDCNKKDTWDGKCYKCYKDSRGP